MRIEKFIDEISTLVEKDIINGKTLKERIHGEEFKKQKVQKFFTLGIDFPTEYAEVALEHLKQAMCDRDDYKLADCLYYEWRDIAIVLQEVIDEVE